MGLERHPGHWRWVGGPVPRGSSAITIGPVVSIRRRSAGNETLLRHELVHVEQWRRLGVVGFLSRYLGAYFRWRLLFHAHRDAYRRIPLEIEADWRAKAPGAAGAVLPPQ